jgi:hypothetical protein
MKVLKLNHLRGLLTSINMVITLHVWVKDCYRPQTRLN